MPIPPWLYSARVANEEIYTITIDASVLNGKSVYLTDARGNGILLRDGRLTLSHSAALAEFAVTAVGADEITLESKDAEAHVTVGDKGAFYANANQDGAKKFKVVVTDLGWELQYDTGRPSVFDDYYDISIGEWQKGRSRIPILIHSVEDGLASVWGPLGMGSTSGGQTKF